MNVTTKLANNILNSKSAVYLTKPNAATAAATIALVSNLTKDAVNCYYYVVQSLTNDRIPEDKRKFVAGLDLSNGILNVITQTGVGIILPIITNNIFEKKVVPKYFSKEAMANMYKKLKPNIPLSGFEEKLLKNKAFAKVGLSVISTLVGTQVIAKRIIVPLIATPLASYFKTKFEQMEGKDKKYQDSVTFENKENIIQKNKNIPKCFQSFMQ